LPLYLDQENMGFLDVSVLRGCTDLTQGSGTLPHLPSLGCKIQRFVLLHSQVNINWGLDETTSGGPFQPRLFCDCMDLVQLFSLQQVTSDSNVPAFPFWQGPDLKTRKESMDPLHHVCEFNWFAGACSCNISHDKQGVLPGHFLIGLLQNRKMYLTFWVYLLEDNLLDGPSRRFKAGNFMQGVVSPTLLNYLTPKCTVMQNYGRNLSATFTRKVQPPGKTPAPMFKTH